MSLFDGSQTAGRETTLNATNHVIINGLDGEIEVDYQLLKGGENTFHIFCC